MDPPVIPTQWQSGLDIDATLYEISNRNARSQLARQISSSSSIHRQRASRIMKANSAGNSPQHVQRRRAATSFRQPSYRADLCQPGFRMSQQDYGTPTAALMTSMDDAARPVSWHPSSVELARTSVRYSNLDMAGQPPLRRPSFGGYQTVEYHGLPTPMTQPSRNSDVPTDAFFSLDPAMPFVAPQIPQYSNYNPAGLGLDTSFNNPINHNRIQFPLCEPSYLTTPASEAAYSQVSPMSFATRTWAESLSPFPAFTAPPTPDFPPMPCESWLDESDMAGIAEVEECEPQLPFPPPIKKKASHELIGMGLYDRPDRDSMAFSSARGSLALSHFGIESHRESIGKGLKLEDAWEPPEEEESSEAEEDEMQLKEPGVENGIKSNELVDLMPMASQQMPMNLVDLNHPLPPLPTKATMLHVQDTMAPPSAQNLVTQSFYWPGATPSMVQDMQEPVAGMVATMRGVDIGAYDWY